MKKKILLFIIAIFTFSIGMITVNAQVPTISKESNSPNQVGLSDAFEEGYVLNILLQCDSTNNTDLYTVHYILDGGQEEIEDPVSCSILGHVLGVNKSKLSSTEHSIEAWIEDNGGNESNHITSNFIIVNTMSQEYEDNNGILKLNISGIMRNTSVVTTKVTDQDILNRLGYNDAYKIEFVADGKDLDYYMDTYDLLPEIDGVVNLPSGLTASHEMKAYIVDKNFSNINTFIDCGVSVDPVCDGKFDIWGLKKYNKGYIYFGEGDYEETLPTTTDTSSTDTTVKVPNTSMTMPIIYSIVGVVLFIIGTIIIKLTFLKKKND